MKILDLEKLDIVGKKYDNENTIDMNIRNNKFLLIPKTNTMSMGYYLLVKDSYMYRYAR